MMEYEIYCARCGGTRIFRGRTDAPIARCEDCGDAEVVQ